MPHCHTRLHLFPNTQTSTRPNFHSICLPLSTRVFKVWFYILVLNDAYRSAGAAARIACVFAWPAWGAPGDVLHTYTMATQLFDYPSSIALDGDGRMYVVLLASGSCNVTVLAADGTLIRSFATGDRSYVEAIAVDSAGEYIYTAGYGSIAKYSQSRRQSAAIPLSTIRSSFRCLCRCVLGKVYVIDPWSERLDVLTADGTLIHSFLSLTTPSVPLWTT